MTAIQGAGGPGPRGVRGGGAMVDAHASGGSALTTRAVRVDASVGPKSAGRSAKGPNVRLWACVFVGREVGEPPLPALHVPSRRLHQPIHATLPSVDTAHSP